MRRQVMLGIVATIGLGSLAVLGGSPGLVGSILDSFQNRSISNVFSFEGRTQTYPTNADRASRQIESSDIRQANSAEENNYSAPQVPEAVLWRAIFSFPEKLEKAAEKPRHEGQDTSLWTDYFTRQAGLSTGDSQALRKISADFSREIASIDERSRQIIQDFRASDQRRQLDGEPISKLEATARIIELQRQRDEATLLRRDHLKAAIGEQSFARFDKWVKEEFAKGFEIRKGTGIGKPEMHETQNNGFAPINEIPQRDMNIVEEKNK